MIYNFFKSYQPVPLLVLPFLVAALWFWGAPLHSAPQDHPIPFFEAFLTIINNTLIIRLIVATLIIMIGALLTNSLFNRQDFLERSTQLAAFFYCFGLSAVPGNLIIMPLHFSLIFLLLGISQLFNITRAESAKMYVFNAGLFFGIAVIITPGLWPLLFLLWMALTIIRPFKWREYILAICGILVPFLYLIVHLIAIDATSAYGRYFHFQVHQPELTRFYSGFTEVIWAASVIISLFIFLSLSRLLANSSASGLRFKKIARFMVALFILSLFCLILDLIGSHKIGEITILALPLSFVFPYYFFSVKRQKLASFFFHLGILCVLANFFFSLYY